MSEEQRGEIILWSSTIDDGRWKAEVTQSSDTEATLYITFISTGEVKFMDTFDYVLDMEKGVEDSSLEEWQDKVIMWIDENDPEDKDELVMPEEAKIYADGLYRIINRIPEGWNKAINFDLGWYGMIIDLDNELANIRFDYVIKQIKEKDGRLVFVFDLPTMSFECCQLFHEGNEIPPNDGDIPEEFWIETAQLFQEHLKTAEHLETVEKFNKYQEELLPDLKQMHEIVARYVEKSSTICEACGAPGELETLIWKKTLCPKHFAELEKITPEDIEIAKTINGALSFAEVAPKEEILPDGKIIERF